MSKKIFTWVGLAVTAILLVAVNVLGYSLLRNARVDLTENKVYTLSEGTHNILRSIDEPVTLRFYYSSKLISRTMPGLSTYATTVQELLEEYRDTAGGKIRLEVIDPEPFSEEEDAAALAGLTGIPSPSGTDAAFLGLVGTNAVDDTEVIAFFDPRRARTLEYDITRIVYTLSHPQQKVVGVISTLPVMGDQDPFTALRNPNQVRQPFFLVQMLRQMATLRSLGTDVDRIPDDVNVLMVVHPKELSDETLYAIDQFVLRGGHALVFVDPHSEIDQADFDPANPYGNLWANRTSNPANLLAAWGVEMAENRFVGDRANMQRVSMRNQRGLFETVNYVAYLALGEENLSEDDVVTQALGEITVGTAGALSKVDGAATEFTPLVLSSAESQLIDVDRVKLAPQPDELLREFQSTGEQYVLAARLRGKAKTAFPGGLRPQDSGEEPTGHIEESARDINVIVVADTDMLADHFWVQVQNFLGARMAVQVANNGNLVANAVENLSGSNDLIGVRSRRDPRRTFRKVEEIARAAEEKYLERYDQLQQRLDEIERRINEIQAPREGNVLILTPEQQAGIQEARDERVNTRKELRAVRRELNRDIEQLGWRVKFVNIALIPMLIGLYAVALGVIRVARRKR